MDQLAGSEYRDELEQRVIGEIDEAINGIKRAAIDDGRNLNDHPPIDAHITRGDRYKHAAELLNAANHDVGMEEDDPQAQGLQGRIIAHINEAHRILEKLRSKYTR